MNRTKNESFITLTMVPKATFKIILSWLSMLDIYRLSRVSRRIRFILGFTKDPSNEASLTEDLLLGATQKFREDEPRWTSIRSLTSSDWLDVWELQYRQIPIPSFKKGGKIELGPRKGGCRQLREWFKRCLRPIDLLEDLAKHGKMCPWCMRFNWIPYAGSSRLRSCAAPLQWCRALRIPSGICAKCALYHAIRSIGGIFDPINAMRAAILTKKFQDCDIFSDASGNLYETTYQQISKGNIPGGMNHCLLVSPGLGVLVCYVAYKRILLPFSVLDSFLNGECAFSERDMRFLL